MTPDTPYYLASITKMYTATVVMKLARSGEIDLAAPISEYLAGELIGGIQVVDGTDYGGRITIYPRRSPQWRQVVTPFG
jgi:CubicO group peptidase (beta-lactamase class C family)